MTGKIEKLALREKSRQNPENKQTFGLTEIIELEGITRQNAKNKQTPRSNGTEWDIRTKLNRNIVERIFDAFYTHDSALGFGNHYG